MDRQLPVIPAGHPVINEDVAVLTSGARTLAEQVGYAYAEVERRHRFRFLFEPMRLLEQGGALRSYAAGQNPFPASVEIDPANSCNHHCPFCIYSSLHSRGRSERLPTEVLFRVIDELAALGCRSILFVGGGEPMTHNATVDAIERAAGHGVSVGLVTNGSRVFPPLAARLKQAATYVRFSLDASHPALHVQMHQRDDHHKIIANLRALAGAEGPCTVGTGYFINPGNVHDIVACGRLVKDCGADYIQYKAYSGINIEPELHERMLHGIAEAITLSDENFDVHVVDRIFDNNTHQVRGYTRCHWQAFKPVIGADGNVFLCAQKRTNPNGIIGNILESSFADVWTGDRRRRVVEELDLRSCPFCVHDKQNKIIEFLCNFTAPHGAFF
jgi:MoaA/NifB/PqqE/SkfB family radical SAM enzyme